MARRRAKGQIEAQRHQRALGVVADGRVGRIFVLTVILYPGVEAGFGHGLHQPAGRLHDLVDGLVQQLEVSRVVEQARTAKQQVVVVAGKAFEEPQQRAVVFAAIVVIFEFCRPQALDVPGVKILVADEAAQRGVAVRNLGVACAWQVFPVADQRGAAAVLQPAIAVINGVKHEKIVAERRLLAAVPEADFSLAYFLRVGQQLRAVEARQGARHHEAMRHTARSKTAAPEGAHFDRAIRQLVVIGGLVVTKPALVYFLRGEPGRQRPVGDRFRQRHLERVRQLLLAFDLQAQAGAVEEPATGIQPCGAHRVVSGIDVIADHQRFGGRAVDLPGAFVQLQGSKPRAQALPRLQTGKIFGEFPNQVAAWNPHRKRQPLLRRRPCNGERDAKQVVVGLHYFHEVVKRIGGSS